jgi:hypothetical protein
VLTFEREIGRDKFLHTTIGITMFPAQLHHRVHHPALGMPPASQHLPPVWQIHRFIRRFPHERDHLPVLGALAMSAHLLSRVLDTSAPISTVAHALEHPVQDTEEVPGDLCLRLLCSQDRHLRRVQTPVSTLVMDLLEQTRSVGVAGPLTTHLAAVSDHS